MNLGELISRQHDEAKIKIGTEYGSGFFFCGTAKEYRCWQNSVNRNMLQRLEKSVEEAEKRLAKAEMTKSKGLPEAQALIYAAKASVERSTLKRNSFKPLSERKVLETLIASAIADEETPMIIYVEGTEDGAYWTIKEAEIGGYPFSLSHGYAVKFGRRSSRDDE